MNVELTHEWGDGLAGCGDGKDHIAFARALSESPRFPRPGGRLPESVGGGSRGDPGLRVRARGTGHRQAQENEGCGTDPRGSGVFQDGVLEKVRREVMPTTRCVSENPVTI